MLGEHHDLVHEFPELRERIHALKVGNPRFARLFAEYNGVDREVRRHEDGVEPVSDDYLESLKRKRVQLKDELYSVLTSRAV